MAITRVNGGIFNGENVGGNLDFFTIHTVLGIEEGNYGDTTKTYAKNLVTLVEAISRIAEPVIASVSSATVDLSVAGNRTLYGFGSAFNVSTTVYTFKFAIEHTKAFGDAVVDSATTTYAHTLASILNGVKLPVDTGALNTIDVSSAANKNVTIIGFNII